MDKVLIKSFDRTFHFGHLNEWLLIRNCPLANLNELPQIGFTAFYEIYPMGCAFLRKCEGNIGIFDSFVLNPGYPRKYKEEIMEGLVLKIIEAATKEKLSNLLAFTQNYSIIERAKKHHFKVLRDCTLSLKIEKEQEE